MKLTGKITAKIHAHTFDGVPEDTTITIFIPGVKVPLKATLSDIEIEVPEPDPPLTTAGGWFIPASLAHSWAGKFSTLWATPPSLTDGDGLTLTGTFTEMVAGTAAPGGVSGRQTLDLLKDAIPGLADADSTCPECAPGECAMGSHGIVHWDTPQPLTTVIMHLNDHHYWSRERIADWLETKDWDLQFATKGDTA